MFRTIIFVFCLLFLQPNNIFAHEEINEIATVADGYNIPILIYLPNNTTLKSPIHFYVHGGGWNGGTATEVPPATLTGDARYLCDALGVIYVGLAYRTKGNNGTFKKAIEDLEASVAWFLARAEQYNADVTRIGFAGSSAGSTLASVMAQKYVNCKLFIGNEGMYNIVDLDPSLSNFPNEQSRADYGLTTPSEKLEASAFYNLRTPNPPATLLLHGKDDWLCHYTQSEKFADKIINSGGKAKVVLYDDINHTCLSVSYPKVFKNSVLEIANHFVTEFELSHITASDIQNIDDELEDILSRNWYRYDTFPLDLVYGTWIDNRGFYTFENDGTAYLINNNNLRFDYTYKVEGAKLLVSDNNVTKTFYMRANNTLYEFITENTRFKSRAYNFRRANNLNVQNFNKTDFNIYPNPTTRKLLLPNSEKTNSFIIYDASGRMIKKGIIKNGEIDVENLNSGIYLLILRYGKRVTFIKK